MSRKRLKQDEQNSNDILFQQEDSRIQLIQLLIPLGLEAVGDLLNQEVEALAGTRYRHNERDLKRWGHNPGSVFIGDQKLKIKVPRVRNVTSNEEVPLNAYAGLQKPSIINEKTLNLIINGISTRKYEKVVEKIPETFGVKKSSVSKKFIRKSSFRLKELLERDLSSLDIIGIFIDGKTFAENEVVVALGVTIKGEKLILGFVETATENTLVITEFLKGLVQKRGLNINHEILFIVDGAKGLTKGIKNVFGDKAIIQRCQWHKRENVVSYLPKEMQDQFRIKLQNAYKLNTYSEAKAELNSIKRELKLINESAVSSLEEGLEETLTLHQLELYEHLGTSFKTTNCIESFNRQMEIYVGRVSRWKNSNQRQRWFATATIEIEKKMRARRIKGYKFLPLLREKMMGDKIKSAMKKAA